MTASKARAAAPPEPVSVERPHKVAVVFNPTAGGEQAGERRDHINAVLEAAGLDTTWLETTKDDTGEGQARKAVADGADLVIASGGDGTVRACASGLAGTEVPLGILPMGTGNIVAANFDIPDDIDDALEIAIECRRRRIDLGAAGDERFVVAAGLGFDAAMLRDANKRLKRRIGPLAYVLSGVKHLGWPHVTFRIRLDGGDQFERRAQDVLICNLGKIQGGLAIMPDAVPDDGVLDIAVVRTRTITDWLVIAVRILLRSSKRRDLVETLRAASVEVSCERPQPLQLDGDPLNSVRSVTIEVTPSELTLAVPAHQIDETAPVRRSP